MFLKGGENGETFCCEVNNGEKTSKKQSKLLKKIGNQTASGKKYRYKN